MVHTDLAPWIAWPHRWAASCWPPGLPDASPWCGTRWAVPLSGNAPKPWIKARYGMIWLPLNQCPVPGMWDDVGCKSVLMFGNVLKLFGRFCQTCLLCCSKHWLTTSLHLAYLAFNIPFLTSFAEAHSASLHSSSAQLKPWIPRPQSWSSVGGHLKLPN